MQFQVAALTTSEKVIKGELSTMQREIEDLQQRYQSAISSRASDKQTISNLERRVAEERRTRCNLESQLNQERKSRKQEEARAAQVRIQMRKQRALVKAVSFGIGISGYFGNGTNPQCCQQQKSATFAFLLVAARNQSSFT